jgi:hypothetical protein
VKDLILVLLAKPIMEIGINIVDVYNLAHPFAKKPEVQSGIAGYHNMARVVLSTLIKEGNEKQPRSNL